MKNILIHYTSGALGGQQMQLFNIAIELLKLKNKVTWVVEAPGYFSNLFESYGGTVIDASKSKSRQLNHIILNNRLSRILMRRATLNSILVEQDPDIVIVSDSITTLLLKLRNYHVLRMIGQDLAVYEKYFRFYRFLRIDKKVDYYLGWPKVYRDLQSKGVSDSKFVDFTYNAVNTNKFKPISKDVKKKIRERLGLKEGSLVIGWVGRIEKENQCINTLLLGKSLLTKNFTNFKLLFVGGGAWINGVEDTKFVNIFKQKSHSLGLGEYTIFAGWVDYDDVNNYMNVMDIIPMLESDPVGGSILREAMSCGKLALSVLGKSRMQEVFMKPSNSVLVSSDNFVERAATEVISLANNQEKMDRLGANARKFCLEHLSFRTQALEINTLLDNYIKPR